MSVIEATTAADREKVINEFYKYCETVENEWTQAVFSKKTNSAWNGKRLANYQNGGVVYGLLYDWDTRIIECLDLEPDFDELLLLMQRIIAKTERHEKNFLQLCPKDARNEMFLKTRNLTPQLTKYNILDWIRGYNCCLLPNVAGLSNQQLLMFLQLSQGYEVYKERQNDLFRYEQPKIESIYLNKDLNDENFVKYRLVPVNQGRKLITITTPCRIYDKDLNKTIFLYVNPAVAKVFEELKNGGFIEAYSFRGMNNAVYDGLCKNGVLLEEIERGVQFSFDVNKLCAVTKLYTVEFYDDQLWVAVNQQEKEIKFEELYNDVFKPNFSDDTVVTRMIHLKYDFDSNENVNIVHIDYEYLFYNLDEYEQRKSNVYIKGTAKRRIKIFKIDRAKIPLNYPCSAFMIGDGRELTVPFIYFIVYMCFNHKKLINEYFDKCVKGISVKENRASP